MSQVDELEALIASIQSEAVRLAEASEELQQQLEANEIPVGDRLASGLEATAAAAKVMDSFSGGHGLSRRQSKAAVGIGLATAAIGLAVDYFERRRIRNKKEEIYEHARSNLEKISAALTDKAPRLSAAAASPALSLAVLQSRLAEAVERSDLERATNRFMLLFRRIELDARLTWIARLQEALAPARLPLTDIDEFEDAIAGILETSSEETNEEGFSSCLAEAEASTTSHSTSLLQTFDSYFGAILVGNATGPGEPRRSRSPRTGRSRSRRRRRQRHTPQATQNANQTEDGSHHLRDASIIRQLGRLRSWAPGMQLWEATRSWPRTRARRDSRSKSRRTPPPGLPNLERLYDLLARGYVLNAGRFWNASSRAWVRATPKLLPPDSSFRRRCTAAEFGVWVQLAGLLLLAICQLALWSPGARSTLMAWHRTAALATSTPETEDAATGELTQGSSPQTSRPLEQRAPDDATGLDMRGKWVQFDFKGERVSCQVQYDYSLRFKPLHGPEVEGHWDTERQAVIIDD